MGKSSTTMDVGLDVHKAASTSPWPTPAATAKFGMSACRHVGSIGGDLVSLDKALRKLISKGQPLNIVYEAGPCGFVVWRRLTTQGLTCEVVAPSSIPKRSGDRVKTERRDAILLARLARVGELTAVRVPDAADEAVRDLVRAREDAVRECRNACHHLKALLLRNGITYAGKCAWAAAHLRWLARLKMAHATQQIGFQEYLHAITEATARIGRVQRIAAMTLVAELQDFTRFANPRQLMSYVGLVPGESSSGPKRRQGAITKAGNSAARRVLVEVAWHYQHSARVTPIIAKR
jgi:transposase